MPAKRLPSATYRVQLNQDFRFADAAKLPIGKLVFESYCSVCHGDTAVV